MRLPLALRPSTDRAFDAVGLGQNSLDLVAHVHRFPSANTKQPLLRLNRIPGGQVASAMVCCARLGWRAAYVGRFGHDEAGAIVRASLVDEGVNVSTAQSVTDARTRTAIVVVDEASGERTVLWDRDERLRWPADRVPTEPFTRGRVVLVDAEDMTASISAASIARDARAVTVVDVDAVEPCVDELLRHIDVIIVSEGFPEQLTGIPETGRALEHMANSFRAALSCVTLGANGCLARCGDREFHVPAFRITCVDSTGAGDAFRGGFMSALLASDGNADVVELLRYANAVAGLNCRRAGARDGLPTRAEVAQLLNTC